jgi:hypothetical protein
MLMSASQGGQLDLAMLAEMGIDISGLINTQRPEQPS